MSSPKTGNPLAMADERLERYHGLTFSDVGNGPPPSPSSMASG